MYIQFQINTIPDKIKNLKEFAESIVGAIMGDYFHDENIEEVEIEKKTYENDPRYLVITFYYKDGKQIEKKFKDANEFLSIATEMFGFQQVAEYLVTNVEILSIKAREYKSKVELDKDKKTTNFWA